MSSRNPNRGPVQSRGRRIPGLYERRFADGTGSVFEFVGRLNGRVRTVKLDARTKTAAVDEVESLRSGVRERRIEISADRRKTVHGARVEYVDYLRALEGTRGEKAPATIEDTESKLDLYVLPTLGHLPTAAVTEREIETLARSARHRSESTVRSILSVGSQFFAWGLRQRYCDHNPVKRAREIYGDTLLPHSEPKTQRALTDDEVANAIMKLTTASARSSRSRPRPGCGSPKCSASPGRTSTWTPARSPSRASSAATATFVGRRRGPRGRSRSRMQPSRSFASTGGVCARRSSSG